MTTTKKLFQIVEAKSKWAKTMVKDHGATVQLADEKLIDGHPQYRFVSPLENDTWDFKHWSYWVPKSEVTLVEV